jgi:WD40 repeat protein
MRSNLTRLGIQAIAILLLYCVPGIFGLPASLAIPVAYGQDNGTRTWRDASGIFAVQAKLHELQPEVVKLRSEDGKIVEIRRDRLCEQDRGFLVDFEKTHNPFRVVGSGTNGHTAEVKSLTSVPPQKPQSILQTLKNVKLFSRVQPLEKLESDHKPLPIVPPGEAYVDSVQSGSRLSPILLLGREQKKVAISVSPSIYYSNRRQPSRVYVGNLPNGPFQKVVDSADPLSLLDHCVETGQTLATGSKLGDSADRELILFEGLNAGELREVSRFLLPVNEEKNSRVNSARLIGKNRAIVVVDGVAHSWDLGTGDQIFQTDPHRQRRGVEEITFCGDRRLMIVPSGDGIHFIGTESGEDHGYLPLGNTYAMRFVFDPRANRIAYCDRDCWGMYDYSTLERRSPQTTTLALSSKLFGWLAPNLILAGDGVVLDDQLGIPVWRYQAKWENSRIWENSITIVDDGAGLKLQTLEFPDADLRMALNSKPPIEQWLATDTGTHVRLQLDLPETLPENVNASQLRERLESLAMSAGWVADDSASLSLIMSIAPGKKFKDFYQQWVGGSPRGDSAELEIVPMISRLELREDEKVIWSIQSQNDQPNRYLQSPYAKDEYIKQRERALPEFFSGIQVPVRIPRPPYTYGFGSKYARNILWQNQSNVRHVGEQASPAAAYSKVPASPKAEVLEKRDIKTGVVFSISTNRPPNGMPTRLQQSPDGKLTVVVSDHAKAQLVEVDGMQPFGEPLEIPRVNRNRNVSEQWAFSPNGRYVAISQSGSNVGGEDTEGKIYVWEIATGKRIANASTATHDLGRVHEMAFSADSQTVVVYSQELSGK